MSSQAAFEGVGSIIEAQAAELDERLADAAHVRERLVVAKIGVGNSEVEVKTATERLAQAKSQVRTHESEEQHAERTVESSAQRIAADIATRPDLDPVAQTLFALVYDDSTLAWKEEPNVYRSAADRGRTALSSIMGRLQPGEPILYFGQGLRITANVATAESLVAQPPKVDKRRESYIFLTEGSIYIDMPKAPTAHMVERDLVVVEREEDQQATLISNRGKHGVERLEVLATNEQVLVIGGAAVLEAVRRLNPVQRFVALTALKTAGIDVPARVDDEVRENAETRLVNLSAFLASGVGQETITQNRLIRRSPGQITVDSDLTRMAKFIDKQSIRAMAQTIGLSKEQLHGKVKQALESRTSQDNVSLGQLAKDVSSLENLAKILDSIF